MRGSPVRPSPRSSSFPSSLSDLSICLDVPDDPLPLCVTVCGAIADYNTPNPTGLTAYLNLISQSASIQGFIVFNFSDRYHIAAADMAKHIRSGALKVRETRTDGLDQCVNALVGLFAGANTGKSLVKIGDEGAPKL